MPLGTLEVLLVEAKGLKNKDFLYEHTFPKTKENKDTQMTSTHLFQYYHWKGCDLEWNESFLFTVTDDVFELRLKIMDKDTFTKDDFVGEAIVPLEPLFADGRLPPTAYNVVVCGESTICFCREAASRRYDEENYGGWKELSF
ncbi:unnamed protein product [Malus baccata var. baccata]